MRVRFVKQHLLPAVGSTGPFTRVFEIGEVHDLPTIHAVTIIAQGDAVVDEGKPVPRKEAQDAEPQAAKKVTPRKRSK